MSFRAPGDRSMVDKALRLSALYSITAVDHIISQNRIFVNGGELTICEHVFFSGF